MAQVSYKDHTVEIESLPGASILAMFSRGFKHYLGNETASKLVSWKDKAKAEGRDLSEDEVEAKKAELIAAAMTALANGSVGTATRQPSVDPLEAEIERLAARDVREHVRKVGGVVKDGKAIFSDKTEDFDALIERYIAKFGAKVTKEAKVTLRVKEEARAAREAAKAGNGGSVEGLDF